MSRRTMLSHGSAGDAADALDDHMSEEDAHDELRAALINALRRIERLERSVAELNGDEL